MDKRTKAIKGGIASGLARQTPELLAEKAEVIRLHAELDYGIQAIFTKTGINKGRARRWLIAAGVYRTGHRAITRDYGASRVPWKYKTRPIRQESVTKHQRLAWLGEWAFVSPWDEQSHWWMHRERRAHAWCLAAQRQHQRLKSSPQYRVAKATRNRVWKLVTNEQFAKVACSMDLVGCSKTEFVAHLEQQFKPGMSWANYGSSWEIDHIRPCASFDLSQPEQQRQCFHYSNLQPLTVSDNRTKHDTWHGK